MVWKHRPSGPAFGNRRQFRCPFPRRKSRLSARPESQSRTMESARSVPRSDRCGTEQSREWHCGGRGSQVYFGFRKAVGAEDQLPCLRPLGVGCYGLGASREVPFAFSTYRSSRSPANRDCLLSDVVPSSPTGVILLNFLESPRLILFWPHGNFSYHGALAREKPRITASCAGRVCCANRHEGRRDTTDRHGTPT